MHLPSQATVLPCRPPPIGHPISTLLTQLCTTPACGHHQHCADDTIPACGLQDRPSGGLGAHSCKQGTCVLQTAHAHSTCTPHTSMQAAPTNCTARPACSQLATDGQARGTHTLCMQNAHNLVVDARDGHTHLGLPVIAQHQQGYSC